MKKTLIALYCCLSLGLVTSVVNADTIMTTPAVVNSATNPTAVHTGWCADHPREPSCGEAWCANHPRECRNEAWCAHHPRQCGK